MPMTHVYAENPYRKTGIINWHHNGEHVLFVTGD